MEKIRVIIVDDHRLFRKCLAFTLENHTEIQVVGTAQTGSEFLNRIKRLKPHIALMGAKVNKVDIMHTAQLAREYFPHVGIIAFIFNNEKEYVQELLQAGVNSILFKDAPVKEIAETIKIVIQEGYYLPKWIEDLLQNQD